jgi:recombination protein RecT
MVADRPVRAPATDDGRPGPSAGPSPGPIRPAATVVVMRDGPDGPEVLLTRRPSTMAFGPGLHVFPGGALDPADDDPRLQARLRVGPGLPSLHAGPVAVAAIRELFEEAGILLATGPTGLVADPAALAAAMNQEPGAEPAPDGQPPGAFASAVLRAGLELRADWLVPMSRWVTPPVVPRRFDARFFVARLPDGCVPAFDSREVADHAWMTPRAALEAMADGRIELWTPTSTTLQQLTAARNLDDVRQHLAPDPSADGQARLVMDRPAPSITRIRFAGAGGIAGQTVDTFLVGKRRLVVVDPGDPSDAAAEEIAAVAARLGARLAGILVTAPVPDHAGGAEGLSLRFGIPLRAAPGAGRVLVSEIEPVVDGQLLDLADVPIRAHASPGTHPDHMAYEVPAAGVVLVGDLDGPGPARAIPEVVDEPALATSRRRINGLDTRLRLAAHR